MFFKTQLACVFLIVGVAHVLPGQSPSILSVWNLEAPFPYLHGETRSWPIFQKPLPEGTGISLTARQGDKILGQGKALQFSGLSISINDRDQIQVTSEQVSPLISFELEVTLSQPDGANESQNLEVRPAPPNRPLSYVSDLIDDIIHTFQN